MDAAPDLAGVYVTDEHIDIVLGRDVAPSQRKSQLSDLALKIDIRSRSKDDDFRVVSFADFAGVEESFIEASRWILDRAPKLRSVGVGCYGPFLTLDRRARDAGDPSYGRLAKTSHGVHLSGKSLVALLRKGFEQNPRFQAVPLITVETDVAAAVIGEVYNRSWEADGSRRPDVDLETIAFVKVSLGVGGSFMRAATPWYGRHHPEMGQIQVPRWRNTRLDPKDIEKNWTTSHKFARNPDSIEALASAYAIEERYAPARFAQLKSRPRHRVWDRQAWYLAQLAWTLTCMVAPTRIVFGGRVMGVPGLIDRVRETFRTKIAGVESFPFYPGLDDLDRYLSVDSERHAKDVGRPGIIGALCIAAMEHRPPPVVEIPRAELR